MIGTVEYLDLLEAPYKHGGRGPGYDCLGIVLEVQRRAGYDVRDPVEAYCDGRAGHDFREAWASTWKPTNCPRVYDAVLMHNGARWHVGVIVEPNKVLHAHEAGTPCVERLDVLCRRGVIHGYWTPCKGVGVDAPAEIPGDPFTGTATVSLFGAQIFGGLSAFAAAGLSFVGNLAISAGLGLLVQSIAAPSKQGLDAQDDARPSFSLGGGRNTVANGATIPAVYGEHRIAGHILSIFYRADANFRTRLYMLICDGWGPYYSVGGFTADTDWINASAVNGTNVEINGNPIKGFPTARFACRLGTISQSPIIGFEESVTNGTVDQELKNTTGTSNNVTTIAENADTITYSTTTEIDAFELNLRFPIGLYGYNSSGAKIMHSWIGTLRYRIVGSTTETVVFLQLGARQLAADHTETKRFTVPTRGFYEISLTRSSLADDLASNPRFSQCIWSSVNEISTQTAISYAGRVLKAIEIPADQVSGSVPTVTSIDKGRLCPVWDGVSLTSPTFTREWSDNPAWVALDLLTDRWIGVGAFIRLNEIDLQSFKDLADYCDASITTDGTTHPRWQFDHVFESTAGAWDTLLQILASCRSAPTLTGGKLGIKVETTESRSQVFGMGNVIRGSIEEELINTSTQANVVEIEYVNRDTNWSRDVAQLGDPGTDDIVKSTTRLIGITRAVHAYRHARYFLNFATTVTKRLTFSAPIDAIAVAPGSVLGFSHNRLTGTGSAKSGRVVGNISATDAVVIDQPVVIAASSSLTFRTYNTSTNAEVITTVTPTPGTYAKGDTITFSPSVSAQERPKDGDIYALGPSINYLKDWRVVNITQGPDFISRIECIEYDADVYDDDPGVIETFTEQYPDSRAALDVPTNLSAQNIAERQKDGSINSYVDVSFVPSRAGVDHDVWYRFASIESGDDEPTPSGWTWVTTTRSTTATFTAANSYRRTIDISVTPRSPGGTINDPDHGARASVFIGGSIAEPAAPSNIVAQQVGDQMLIYFDESTSLDVDRYEVRQSSASQRWAFQPTLAVGRGSPIACFPASYASSYLLIKAKSRSGITSILPGYVAHTPTRLSGVTLISDVISGSDWTASGTADTNFTLSGGNLVSDAAATSAEWTSDVDGHCLAKKHVRIHAHLDAKATDTVTEWADAWWDWDSWQAQNRDWSGELFDIPHPEQYPTWAERVDDWDSPTSKSVCWDGTVKEYSLKLEYALSSDSGASSFGSWIEYVGPFETKSDWWVKWRVTFTSAAGQYSCQLLGLTVTVFDLMPGRADTPYSADGAFVMDDPFWASSTENGEIGAYQWNLAGTSATIAIGATDLDQHPGQYDIATQATSANYASIGTNSTGHFKLGTAVVRFTTWVRVVDTTAVIYVLGLTDSVSSSAPRGVYFTATNGANWSLTLKAGATTNNNTGVAAAAGWWKLDLCIIGSTMVKWTVTDEAGSATSGSTTTMTNLDTTSALTLNHLVHTTANASKTLGVDRTRFVVENLGI